MAAVPCEEWDVVGYSYGGLLAGVLAGAEPPVAPPRPVRRLLLVAPAIDQDRRHFSGPSADLFFLRSLFGGPSTANTPRGQIESDGRIGRVSVRRAFGHTLVSTRRYAITNMP